MTKKETYELVIKQLLAEEKEIDFSDHYGKTIDEIPTVLVEDVDNKVVERELYLVSLNSLSNNIEVEVESYGDDDETLSLDESHILPSEYEKIANVIHKCLFPKKTRILTAVDTSDNTKLPICICQVNHDGTINEKWKVINAICETLNVDYMKAADAIVDVIKTSDGIAKMDTYEVFFEDCPCFIGE